MNKIAVMVAGLFMAGAANAQMYVDVHAGQVTADLPSVNGWTVDKKDTAYAINLGYKINNMISVEGGYIPSIEGSYSSNTAVSGSGGGYTLTDAVFKGAVETDGYTLGVAMDLPVNDVIDVSGRAGMFMWDAKETVTLTSGTLVYNGTTYAAGSSISGKSDGSDPYWGLGVGYKVNKNVRAGVNFTRYTVDDVDADAWTASLRYSF
ncbi:MAG: outer membrane beta-barrel protein [Rhodocyclaceae bacterium]|nr:outer membrane beta-barrel protein [Rhodocyclaceae bacterium]